MADLAREISELLSPAMALAKPPFWSGIALDDAMRGRKVLHVSLDKTVDHIREFYDEIFMDLAHSADLEDLPTERLDMERNRMIHTYAGGVVYDPISCAIRSNFLKEVCPLRAGLPDP